MCMMETRQQYIDSVSEQGKEWLLEFYNYMDSKYPMLEATIFRQRPMYKFKNSYLDGYIMFTIAKTHFTFHTLNFELIEEVKPKLPNADFGKGSIKVKFWDKEAVPILKKLCDKIVKVNMK